MPFWPDLRRRCVTPEVMDQPGLDAAEHARALRGLSRINTVSGSAGIHWPNLRDLARSAAPEATRVLDVATGGGDVPLRLWRKARRAGIRMRIAGCDRSPVAVETARRRAADAGADIDFFPLDLFSEPLPIDYDAITCSLFLHHLHEPQAVDLLRRLAGAARRLVLINDLARGLLEYALVYFATRLLSRSPVVHTDGLLSMRAAFTPNEAVALAWQAGMTGAIVERRRPCRFLLAWVKPNGA
jgi:2-polyprenyl-3-methyl-5-hydroxy-6-metoxy-1,4-benzoquinol methylase